jgi:hypothetical protein
MDCSTGGGGKVKQVRIGIRECDGEVNNTGIKKKKERNRNEIKTLGSGTTIISLFW